jgi:hypothetical protein
MTAAGGGGKLAAKHHFLFIAFSIATREKGFYLSLVPPGADHVSRELVAKHEIDGFEYEALACAGLAGEGIHAGAEFQLHVVDEREAAYAKIFQHVPPAF